MTDIDGTQTDREFWVAHLGSRLKAHRVGKYTVEELSGRSGVSPGLISQIERGIGNPSFATLLRLASSLDLPLSSMFTEPTENSDQMLVRRTDRRRIEIPSQGIIQEQLVPPSETRLGVVLMTIPRHFDGSSVPHVHDGVETVILQSGQLTATVNDRQFQLESGDSLTYDSSLPHWWSNDTDVAAAMLAISTPPSMGRAH